MGAVEKALGAHGCGKERMSVGMRLLGRGLRARDEAARARQVRAFPSVREGDMLRVCRRCAGEGVVSSGRQK